MNSRLSQDAADSLVAHEARRIFRDLERARWAMAQPHKIVDTWAPMMTEQEKREHDARVIEHKLPF
jgi:ATP-dependent helicase/DNAse subunit B